jgi:L-amino acid N-acyltransferase YncA
MRLAEINESDYPAIAEIYREGIATGNATFETDVPSWQQWNDTHLLHSRIAFIDDDEITAWAALSPVSGRCVYGGVAEVSVYVKSTAQRKGIGSRLLKELIKSSEQNGIWTLQAGIFPENLASIKIHELCGFRIVGIRERLGKMNGKWRDVCLMERRSQLVGMTEGGILAGFI